MKKNIVFLFFLSCLFIRFTESTNLEPWFGYQLENECRAFLSYESFKYVDSNNRLEKDSSDDLFLTVNYSNSPEPLYSFEIEGTVAKTRQKSNFFDNFRLTGRYNLFDDIAGDPLSLVAGITLTKAFKGSLHDLASFHHGLYEAEFTLAIGKEKSCGELWTSRWYAVGGIGIAEKGSPWIRGDIVFDYRLREHDMLRGFMNTLWGLGGNRLNPHHFKGYGPINHQSIDVGLRYNREIEYVGELSLAYAYRVYARNYPAKVNMVIIELYYPFCL